MPSSKHPSGLKSGTLAPLRVGLRISGYPVQRGLAVSSVMPKFSGWFCISLGSCVDDVSSNAKLEAICVCWFPLGFGSLSWPVLRHLEEYISLLEHIYAMFNAQ